MSRTGARAQWLRIEGREMEVIWRAVERSGCYTEKGGAESQGPSIAKTRLRKHEMESSVPDGRREARFIRTYPLRPSARCMLFKTPRLLHAGYLPLFSATLRYAASTRDESCH